MKNILFLALVLTGLLFSCEKSPFCQEEPPIDWLTEDCDYPDLDAIIDDQPLDSIWCDGQIVVYRNVTKRIIEPLVIDAACGYYIGGVVQYYWGEELWHTIDYNLGNGRGSQVSYIVHNPSAPCENVRQGCYFQQPCNPSGDN